MATLTPMLKVWVATDGSGASWNPAYQTADLDEAVAVFGELAGRGAHVAIYEHGRFQYGAKLVVGFVGFWWSDNLNAYMQGAPAGRGRGWAENYDVLVDYEYYGQQAEAAATALQAYAPAASPAAEVADEVMAKQYAQGVCEGCGVIASMHDLRVLEREVETGRSSGTSRSSESYSSTRSSRGYSESSRHGHSSTSGRRYYKRVRLLLCGTCYAQQASPVGNFFRAIFGP